MDKKMNTTNHKFFLLFILFIQMSCSQSEKQCEWDLCKEKSNDFLKKYSISTQPISTDATISIDEWLLDDTLVVCTTSKNEYCFYRLQADNFNLIDSLGKRGNGPNEFVFPHISRHSFGIYYVIDNGNNKSYVVSKDSIVQLRFKNQNDLITAPQMINYPIIGYVKDLQSEKIWRKQNMLSGEILDSLHIREIKSKNGIIIGNDFSWSHCGDKVVLGFLYQNQFAVGIQENNTPTQWTLFSGDTQTDGLYYSDVVCGEECIYLLSQQQVNMKTQSGYSKVDIYNYDGRPLASIDLDIIARRMLIDEEDKRIILLSPLDDNIHVGILSEESGI